MKEKLTSLKSFLLKKLENSKPLATFVVTVVMLLPLEICVTAWWLLGPEGFWQKLAMVALSTFFFGTLQVVFLVFGVGALNEVWKD